MKVWLVWCKGGLSSGCVEFAVVIAPTAWVAKSLLVRTHRGCEVIIERVDYLGAAVARSPAGVVAVSFGSD